VFGAAVPTETNADIAHRRRTLKGGLTSFVQRVQRTLGARSPFERSSRCGATSGKLLSASLWEITALTTAGEVVVGCRREVSYFLRAFAWCCMFLHVTVTHQSGLKPKLTTWLGYRTSCGKKGTVAPWNTHIS
jgi:hypothetical protein